MHSTPWMAYVYKSNSRIIVCLFITMASLGVRWTFSPHESSKYKTIETGFPHAKVFPFLIIFLINPNRWGENNPIVLRPAKTPWIFGLHGVLAGLSTIGLISNTFEFVVSVNCWALLLYCRLLITHKTFMCLKWSICEWWWFTFLKLLIQSLKHSLHLGMYADSTWLMCATSWLMCATSWLMCATSWLMCATSLLIYRLLAFSLRILN